MRRAGVVVLDGMAGAVRREQLDAAFADQFHLVAQARLQRQRFAEQAFGAVVAINIGMVETGHAQRHALLDKGQALLRRHVPFADAPHAGDDARQFGAVRREAAARGLQAGGENMVHR